MSTESFLARWSLRKQASRVAPAPAAEPPISSDPDGVAPLATEAGRNGPVAEATVPDAPPSEEPAHDGSAPCGEARPDLPDLADLDAGSDYRGFLDRQVPRATRVAALRKAWTSDPVIAGYRPLADYDWDFNAPGYGALRPTDDPSKFITALFRHLQPKPEEVEADQTATAAEPPPVTDATPSEPVTAEVTAPVATDLDAASDAAVQPPSPDENPGPIRGSFPGEDPGPIVVESSTIGDSLRHGSRLKAGNG